ncbi:hypothetical protein BOW53_15945 [Solemya pervernicosa gill symbiont]|uniref:Uncharacterized protein n=1 Tax=Solemya pervernicosa gill symbiont TaxID=642797 RepID=A0A1T2KZQ5_9GAMM|nr:hypothetical protein [Solemya pervernicosa gill symbiont]OOZ38325.1 hypothetical protein BOW53_15945 [Solemya pervernicosa gill symbiont]
MAVSGRFDEFVEITRSQPAELFSSLAAFTLERGQRLNQNWFIHAAFEIAATEAGWPVAETFIKSWLNYYNKDARDQTNRYPKVDKEQDLKRLKMTQKGIQTVLASLSPYEKSILDQMTEVAGDTDSLFTLALKLLAGHPLTGFVNSFVALGIGLSLDQNSWSARNAFQQLTTFNTVDIDATKAVEIAEKLRGDWQNWKPPSPNEWRQSRVADPDLYRPIDMDEGLREFSAINQGNMMQAMGQSREDYLYRDFLPFACRFEPNTAVKKTRQLLADLLSRTGLPLRQLIFNGLEYAPLITPGLATNIIARMVDADMVNALPEREQDILRMFLFEYIAPCLTPSEQLNCLINPSFGSDCLLNVIPSLKQQLSGSILDVLQAAVEESDYAAAYGALVASRYGNTPITLELESLILHFREAKSSKLRAICFDLAIHNNLKVFRDAHVQSDWSAHDADTSTYEKWFGSFLLVKACANKELDFDEMLKRIKLEMWLPAANHVGEEVTKKLASRFLFLLNSAIGVTKNQILPAVDITLSTIETASYPILSLDELCRDYGRFPHHKAIKQMSRMADDFDMRQKCLHEISDTFFKRLEASDARLFVEHVTISDLRMIVEAEPMIMSQILEALKQASSTDSMWLKNFMFVVANLVSKDMPERAVTLFKQAINTQGFVTYALGDDLTLEHQAIWASAPSVPMSELWCQRLLSSINDEALCREVNAAERFGAEKFIKAFVEERANNSSTLDQAYAITVAGFSVQSLQFIDVIEDYLNDAGITGKAAIKAKVAHEVGAPQA